MIGEREIPNGYVLPTPDALAEAIQTHDAQIGDVEASSLPFEDWPQVVAGADFVMEEMDMKWSDR
jgi:hypothetical protein